MQWSSSLSFPIFHPRDFQFNRTIIEKQKLETTNLEKAKNKAYPPLIKWLKGNFSEAFLNWTHVKALRLFTESVLRYGLPATFMVGVPGWLCVRVTM